MPFPFAAALAGIGAVGSIGSALFGGSVQGRGKVARAIQAGVTAQVKTASRAQQYFEAAADVTHPLFRQTAMLEEARLRRAISEGVASAELSARRARARGLTGGVRSDREDESRNRALTSAYASASEAAGGLASNRLQAAGRGILGVAASLGDAYGQATQGTLNLSNLETAASFTRASRFQQGFNALGTLGGALGGYGQLEDLITSRAAAGGGSAYGGFDLTPYFDRQPQFYGGR